MGYRNPPKLFTCVDALPRMKPFLMGCTLVIIIIVLSSAGCTDQNTLTSQTIPTTPTASANKTIDGITIPTSTG